MPIYGYSCDACGLEFDRRQSIKARPLRKCPHCGRKSLKKAICAPYVITHQPHTEVPREAAESLGIRGAGRRSKVYGPPKDQGGLFAASFVGGEGGGDLVMHANLAGPPPGMFMREGRVVVVKNESEKKK